MTTYDSTPLDVLSDLLKNRGETLQTTTLSELTTAYLAWLDQARDDRLPLNAEFAYVAATLIQWKSRHLLCHPDEESAEVAELLDKLQTEDARRGADALRTRLEKPSYWRQVTSGDIPSTGDESPTEDNSTTVVEQATVAELIDTLEQALRRASAQPVRIEKDPVTSQEMPAWLLDRVQSGARFDLNELLNERPTEQPALFLSTLELARKGDLQIDQHESFAPCTVYRPVT